LRDAVLERLGRGLERGRVGGVHVKPLRLFDGGLEAVRVVVLAQVLRLSLGERVLERLLLGRLAPDRVVGGGQRRLGGGTRLDGRVGYVGRLAQRGLGVLERRVEFAVGFLRIGQVPRVLRVGLGDGLV